VLWGGCGGEGGAEGKAEEEGEDEDGFSFHK
jgi:hypothetical protein